MEARIERLITRGRIFVRSGRKVSRVVAAAHDADVDVLVTPSSLGGWWIEVVA